MSTDWQDRSTAAPTKRRGRWLALLTSVLVAGVVIALAIKPTVQTRLRGALLATLEQFNGGPVRYASSTIADDHIILHGVELLSPDAALVWARFGELRLDVGWRDAIRGKRPTELVIKEPLFRWQVGPKGELLPAFPSLGPPTGKPAPVVRIIDGSVTIASADRPPWHVDKLQLTLRPEPNAVVIRGKTGPLFEAQWQLAGSLDRSARSLSLTADANDVHLTQKDIAAAPRLAWLPSTWRKLANRTFDSRGDWQVQLELAGQQPAHLQLQHTVRTLEVAKLWKDQEARFQAGAIAWNQGRLTVKNLTGKIGLFDSRIDATYAVADGTLQLTNNFACRNVPVKQLESILLRPLPEQPEAGRINAQGIVTLRGKQTIDDGNASPVGKASLQNVFTADAAGNVADMVIDGLHIPSVGFRVEIGGQTDDSDRLTNQLRGQVHVTLPETQLEIKRLTARLLADSPVWDGFVTVSGQASVPFQRWQDRSTWQGQFDISSARILTSYVAIEDLQTSLLLAGDGTLKSLVRAGNCRLRNSRQSFASLPPMEVTANLSAPVNEVHRLGAWSGSGLVNPLGPLCDNPVATVSRPVPFSLDESAIAIDSDQLRLAGSEAAAQLSARLVPPYAISATLRTKQLPTAVVRNVLVGRLRMDNAWIGRLGQPSDTLDLQLLAKGTLAKGVLSDWQITIAGTAPRYTIQTTRSSNSRAPRETPVLLVSPSIKLHVNQERIVLERLRATLFGGEFIATAMLSKQANHPSEVSASLTNADASRLTRSISASLGQVIGNITVRTKAARVDASQPWSALVAASSGQLAIRGIPWTQVDSTWDSRIPWPLPPELTWHTEGKAHSGTGVVQWSGEGLTVRTKLAEKRSGEPVIQPALHEARLQLVCRDLSIRPMLSPKSVRSEQWLHDWDGRIDYTGTANLSAPGSGRGTGTFTLRQLTWKDKPVAREMSGTCDWTGRSLRIDKATGTFAQGRATLDAYAIWPSDGGPQSSNGRSDPFMQYSLDINRIRPDRVPVVGKMLHRVTGDIQGRVQGRFQSGIFTGTGTLRSTHLQWRGIPMSGVHMPVQFEYFPGRSIGNVAVRRAQVRVFKGRVTADGAARWRGRRRSTGELNLRGTNLEVRDLVSSFTRSSAPTAGRLTATAELTSRDLQDFNKLSGRIDGELSRVQALRLPVLQQLATFLGPVPLSSPFDEGHFLARIGSGSIDLQELTLAGAAAHLLATGRITLRGQLDVDVVADPRPVGAIPAPLVQLLQSPVWLVSPIPAGVLVEANELLANRLIFLHVGGSIRRPIVRPQTGRQLRQEAVRFFLQQTLQYWLQRRT